MACILLLGATASAQERGTVLRKRVDQRGDLIFAGNSVHTCDLGNDVSGSLKNRCRDAQSGANDGPDEVNNNFNMVYVNAGACGTSGHPACPHNVSTFNSSGAALALPATGTVTWAGLYWFCTTGRPSNQNDPPTLSDRNKILFAVPGGAYTQVVADTGNDGSNPDAKSFFKSGLPDPAPGQGATYLAYVDVTSQVAAGGAGTYWAANMQCGHGATNLFSGWTLAVIYADSDPAAKLRTISVYDAYDQETPGIGSTSAHDIVLHPAGFATPTAGTVSTHIGVVSGDGDTAYEDTLVLVSPDPDNNPNHLGTVTTSMGDGISPRDNVANSTISALGAQVTDRFPAYINTLGFDQDLFTANDALPAGATSARITAHSSTENIFIGVLSFASEVEEPILQIVETVTDVNGLTDGKALPGDELIYTITLTNIGNAPATDVSITDLVPANTSFVPGSITVSGHDASDRKDGDTGELTTCGGAGCVAARPGQGGNGDTGGTINVGASTTVTFHVIVDSPLASGTEITTQTNGTWTGNAVLGGNPTYTGLSDGDPSTPGLQTTSIVVGSSPQIVATKRADGLVSDVNHDGKTNPGEEIDYTLTVRNTGTDAAHGVVITDPLDANVDLAATPTAVPAAQSISTSNHRVVVNIGNLPAGGSVTVTIRVNVVSPFPILAGGQVSNQAVVSGNNFGDVPSDDPEVPGNSNPTVTTVTTAGCECFIDNQCVAVGSLSGLGCLVCNPLLSVTGWSVNAGASCEDGKTCTTGTTCDEHGACTGGTSACEIGLPSCVTSTCGADGSCTNPVIDQQHCLVEGQCVLAGTAAPGRHGCQVCVGGNLGWSAVDDGTHCDDGKFCTVDDSSICQAGLCIGGQPSCNDGLTCTVDTCDEAGQACHNTLPPTAVGEPPAACVIDGACYAAGQTKPGQACLVCNPGANPFGWSDVVNGTVCDMGSGRCDTAQCQAGACVETSTTCNDGIACTIDSCNEATGQCSFTPPAGHCFIDGTCPANGAVDPNDSCRICDATHPGVWSTATVGSSCDDHLDCTVNDRCTADGKCAGTTSCADDGLACTSEVCTGAGCESVLMGGFCVIDSKCYAVGAVNPQNSCERCIPEGSPFDWTALPGCSAPDAGVVTPAPDAGAVAEAGKIAGGGLACNLGLGGNGNGAGGAAVLGLIGLALFWRRRK